MVIIELPRAPSVNRLWRAGRGKVYKSAEYNKWLADCHILIRAQKPNKIKGGYRLIIEAVKPDKRKRDIGNLEKGISDLLQATGIVENDCLCNELISRWVTSGPEMRLLLEPYDVV